MDIVLKEAESRQQLKAVKKLYYSAFPKNERAPMVSLVHRRRSGLISILSAENSRGDFLGLAIPAFWQDVVLLNYLAVEEKLRGTGIGSAILSTLWERYSGKKFVLEIESTRSGAGEQALRRKDFYISNGMRSIDCLVDVFGVEMELMTFERPVSFDEYHELYRHIFNDWVAGNIKLVSGK